MAPRGGGFSDMTQHVDHLKIRPTKKGADRHFLTYDGHIKINSFHVSCKSDKFNGDDMIGIVLYQYDDKQVWKLNGVQCKPGYIYVKKSSNIQHIKAHPNTMHAKCYKSLFGVDPDYSKVVAAGFAYCYNKEQRKKEWKFNSGTFNAPSSHNFEDRYHNGHRGMEHLEKYWILQSLKIWEQAISTVFVSAAAWSWWNGKWIDYDSSTNIEIETKYADYVQEVHDDEKLQNETYAMNLETGSYSNGKKLYKQYRIYFNAPDISLKSTSIHSRNHPKWKNDDDKAHKYFLQQNYAKGGYRIVRRCSDFNVSVCNNEKRYESISTHWWTFSQAPQPVPVDDFCVIL